jgi:hypothetical protein
VALAGKTVAVRVSLPPVTRAVFVLFRLTPLTPTVVMLTVTVQFAVKFPSSVLTVIIAVPADTAFTSPPADTVATLSLSLVQLTFLFVALAGETVAVRVSLPLTAIVVTGLFSLTPLTPTADGLTVTVQLAVKFPSALVAVIIAVPADMAFTTPPADTVATLSLSLDQLTF